MNVILLQLLKSILASVLTEKFVMNLVILLADWLVSRTSNKVDDKLLADLKDSMDKQSDGTPVHNLYEKVKSSASRRPDQ